MSLPNENLRGMEYIEVYAASNINHAISGPVKMFEVRYDYTFRSNFIVRSGRHVEESHRNQTRFIFDLDEYAQAPVNPAVARIPTDDQICFIRIRGKMKGIAQFTDLGPIVAVVPHDFFGVTSPVFSCTGNSVNMGTSLPDYLSQDAVNLHLPHFSQTVSIENLDAADDLLVSFAPGMSPTVVKPGKQVALTGSAVPEFFIGGLDGTPQFTIRCSVVNRG